MCDTSVIMIQQESDKQSDKQTNFRNDDAVRKQQRELMALNRQGA